MDKPVFSIIIPFCDNYAQLIDCVLSLKKTNTPYEVIISVNSKRSIDLPLLKRLSDKLFVESRPVGFTKAVNNGLSIAEGDYMIMCNSDTIVYTPGYLEAFLSIFDYYPNIDALGPVSNNAGYQSVGLDKSLWRRELWSPICMTLSDFYRVEFLNGFFYVFKKGLFLNPDYPHYASEDVLSMRLKFKAVVPRVFVYHHKEQTYSSADRNKLCAPAFKKLKEEYGEKVINLKIQQTESQTNRLRHELYMRYLDEYDKFSTLR